MTEQPGLVDDEQPEDGIDDGTTREGGLMME